MLNHEGPEKGKNKEKDEEKGKGKPKLRCIITTVEQSLHCKKLANKMISDLTHHNHT